MIVGLSPAQESAAGKMAAKKTGAFDAGYIAKALSAAPLGGAPNTRVWLASTRTAI
jgi:hypothetical protein